MTSHPHDGDAREPRAPLDDRDDLSDDMVDDLSGDMDDMSAAEDPMFDALLRSAAASYHRPPPTPREAMWTRIQAARAAERGAVATDATADATAAVSMEDAAASTGTPVIVLPVTRAPRWRTRRWLAPAGLLAAAALLLAVGLGRGVATRGAPAGTVAVVPTVATPPVVDSVTDRATGGEPASTRLAAAPAGVDAASRDRETAAATAAPSRRAPVAERYRPARGRATSPAVRLASASEPADAGVPYEVATVQHFGQAEALLTAFRTATDSQLPALEPWARELLMTTRLLLDSPAARDARYGRMLGQLEPVLAQIVQLPAAPDTRTAEERQFIARSVERTDLLTQLRAVVPAGPAGPQRVGE